LQLCDSTIAVMSGTLLIDYATGTERFPEISIAKNGIFSSTLKTKFLYE